MDENEYNFDFEGNESWALLALLAMIASMSNPEPPSDIPPCCTPYPIADGRNAMQADKISIDEFTIEQMRAAAALKKEEADKLRLSSMYGNCMNKEKSIDDYKRELEELNNELKRRDEPDDYRGLYGRSWDV